MPPGVRGANRTLMVHAPPGASVASLQLSLATANWLASLPDSVTVIVPVGLPPVLVAVNVVSVDTAPGASAG